MHRKALDPEYVEKFMLEEHNFQLIEPYVNSRTPMKGICLICGNKDGTPRWNNVRREGQGACNKCGIKKTAEALSLDPEYVRNKLIHEHSFYPLEQYQSAHIQMKGICLICGHKDGAPRWANVNGGGGACEKCGVKKTAEALSLDPEYVRNKLIHEHSFYPLEPYMHNQTRMKGVCLVCGYKDGTPRWADVNGGQGACSGECRKRGQDMSAPAVAYLAGGYVKDAGPSLKVGIAEARNNKRRAEDNARVGLDTRLATLHFATGREAKDFENELKDLIKSEPGNLYDTGLIFDGSSETFEIDAADPDFVRDLLSHFGLKDVPVPNGLWSESNYRSRFSKWALAA